jgi:hypothetical protein
MNEEQIVKLLRSLSAEEAEHLRHMQAHKSGDAGDFTGAEHVLKSLEVHDLVYRSGSLVSLTHRGKLVAQRL